jgi:hypothetical protein
MFTFLNWVFEKAEKRVEKSKYPTFFSYAIGVVAIVLSAVIFYGRNRYMF